MPSATPELSFVLPAHNEARNIAPMAARLAEVAGPLGSFEIVFVDDGSTDDTLAEIRAAAERDHGRKSMQTVGCPFPNALDAGPVAFAR